MADNLSTSGVLSAVKSKIGEAGIAAVSEQFNQGIALNANAVYIFDLLAGKDEEVGFKLGASAKVLEFKVYEVPYETV